MLRKKKVRIFSFSSYTLFTTATAVLKAQYTKSNSIPGNPRTIICLRNCLNESEGNPEDSENEENDSENEENDSKNEENWNNHLEKLKKMLDRFENVLNNRKSEIDPVFQEKFMKPDSTQNSLKNFPYFPHYLRMFIFYWIERGEISKKFLFVDEEFDILDQYQDWFKKSLILIQDEHPNQNLEEMQTDAGDLLGYVTALRHLTRYNCIAGHVRNANDPDTSEMEKLLSMGAAYIQLFTKSFFIVAIWRQKWAGLKLQSIREDVLDQFITGLLTSPTPGQILLPDELKSSAALSEFIDILFRFDERLDF